MTQAPLNHGVPNMMVPHFPSLAPSHSRSFCSVSPHGVEQPWPPIQGPGRAFLVRWGAGGGPWGPAPSPHPLGRKPMQAGGSPAPTGSYSTGACGISRAGLVTRLNMALPCGGAGGGGPSWGHSRRTPIARPGRKLGPPPIVQPGAAGLGDTGLLSPATPAEAWEGRPTAVHATGV